MEMKKAAGALDLGLGSYFPAKSCKAGMGYLFSR
jgi:hypothetical protein